MTWCARCDTLTTGDAGESCPSCGEPTLDTTPRSRKKYSPMQVLELEQAPVILIEDLADISEEPVEPTVERPRRRRAALSRLRGRSRLLAIALTAALVGGVYAGTRPDLRAGSPTDPMVTPSPSGSSAPAAPVLGQPANGWVVFALEHGFALIDLATGGEHTIDVNRTIVDYAPSPQGLRIAYLDEARGLYVTTAHGQDPVTIATEVNSFSWTPDGGALVVVRSQIGGRGAERTRIELIDISDRATPFLLMETQRFAGPVISGGFSHLVTLYEDDTPSIYDLQPGSSPSLIRKDAALLDVAPDGRRALIATNNGQRLLIIDLNTRRARQIGPKTFLASAARFSPDGRTVAITGSSHFTLEVNHCEGPAGSCDPYPIVTDQTLWSARVKTLELRAVESWPSPEFASPPVWGPNGWVFMISGQRPVAISMTDASRPSIEFTTTYASFGTPPKYLA